MGATIGIAFSEAGKKDVKTKNNAWLCFHLSILYENYNITKFCLIWLISSIGFLQWYWTKNFEKLSTLN